MGALTPAERTGIDDEMGSLTKGKQADIVLLSKTLKVKQVYIIGKRCSIAIPISSCC